MPGVDAAATDRIQRRRALLAAFVLAAASACAPAPGDTDRVLVFVLAGQSNMEGMGRVAADPTRSRGAGSLARLVYDPATRERFHHLVEDDGRFATRDDVWIWFRGRFGPLGPGYGKRPGYFGPEVQFGHRMGDALDAPVLLIKTAWGGRSLFNGFRPPSAGLPSEEEIATVLARSRSLRRGISRDALMADVGKYYRSMIDDVRRVLANPPGPVANTDPGARVLAGFAWHQGWSDGGKPYAVREYGENLAHLIRDVRRDLAAPNLPVVIANSGFGGWESGDTSRTRIAEAQLAVAERPEFRGNVATVETRDFYRPPEQSPADSVVHWNENAETFFLIGDAMADAMLTLPGPAAEAAR